MQPRNLKEVKEDETGTNQLKRKGKKRKRKWNIRRETPKKLGKNRRSVR